MKCSTLLSIREIQIKTTVKYHCTPVRMARAKNSDTTKHGWGCRATRHIGMWVWNSTAIPEKASKKKIKNTTTTQPRDYSPGHLSQRKEKFCPQKILYTNIYGSFIYKSKTLQSAQTSFNRRMFKPTVVYPHHRLLLSNNKGWTINIQNGWDDSPENYAEHGKLIPKGYTLCESIHVTFLKWQILELEDRLVVPRS